MDLEEYFCETLFLKSKIKRMWSSGDGTHWVVWLKKDKDKFYFDSYGVQPPSELIAYLRSPIFYKSERVQQNGEVFCGHLCLFALKELSLGNNHQTSL